MNINDLRLDFNAFRINYKGQWYKKKHLSSVCKKMVNE